MTEPHGTPAPADVHVDVDVVVGSDAPPTADELARAYAWAEWPERERWRLDAVLDSGRWLTARSADGDLLGVVRVLDDGAFGASLWDLLVRPDRRGRGIGSRLVSESLRLCADRRLVVLVSTPQAGGLLRRAGFGTESHGHQAMYLRPPHPAGGHGH